MFENSLHIDGCNYEVADIEYPFCPPVNNKFNKKENLEKTPSVIDIFSSNNTLKLRGDEV